MELTTCWCVLNWTDWWVSWRWMSMRLSWRWWGWWGRWSACTAGNLATDPGSILHVSILLLHGRLPYRAKCPATDLSVLKLSYFSLKDSMDWQYHTLPLHTSIPNYHTFMSTHILQLHQLHHCTTLSMFGSRLNALAQILMGVF